MINSFLKRKSRELKSVGSRRKHIVIDARIRPTSTGRYTDRLLEYLQDIDQDNTYTVLLRSDDGWQPRAQNFTIQNVPFPQFSFNPLHDLKFAKLLRGLRPDLVHFTMTQQPLTYRGRIVTTTHDLTMLRFVRPGKTPLPIFWLKKIGYRVIFLVAHKKSARIIVPSKFVEQDLHAYQPFTKEKTTVTYESSDPPLQTSAERPENVTGLFIMHVGSPFPHKNIQRLIEAFELVRQYKPKLSLVLVGKKEHYFTELEQWAKKRDSYKHITFTGFIPDKQLKWLYQNAEAYVLPSLSEGFGLPGLEAMAHGCPLVSSNATCLPEIYEDAANYFDPRNTIAMAKAIEEVISSHKFQKAMTARGKTQLKKYSWQKMAQETLEVYKTILVD